MPASLDSRKKIVIMPTFHSSDCMVDGLDQAHELPFWYRFSTERQYEVLYFIIQAQFTLTHERMLRFPDHLSVDGKKSLSFSGDTTGDDTVREMVSFHVAR